MSPFADAMPLYDTITVLKDLKQLTDIALRMAEKEVTTISVDWGDAKALDTAVKYLEAVHGFRTMMKGEAEG